MPKTVGTDLVIKDLETTVGWYLTDCGVVKSVAVVTVSTLHKDAGVTEALGIHLSTHVVQVNTCSKRSQPVS